MPRLAHFQVTPEDRQRLQAWVAAPLTPQKHVGRGAIVLATAEGPGHDGDHAPHRQGQGHGVALAGSVGGGWGRGV